MFFPLLLLSLLVLKSASTNLAPSELKWIHDDDFSDRVERSLAEIRRILDEEKSPQLAVQQHPSDDTFTQHTYADKFSLVQVLTNSALSSCMAIFRHLGMDDRVLFTMKEWRKKKQTVTSRFYGDFSCENIGHNKRYVETIAKEEIKDTSSNSSSSSSSTKTKIINIVDDYVHECKVEYHFEIFSGGLYSSSGKESKIQLHQRLLTFNMTTGMPSISKHFHPQKSISSEMDLSWFTDQWTYDDNNNVKWIFAIDRTVDTCRTPTRNSEISTAFDFFHSLYRWWTKTLEFFSNMKRFDVIWQKSEGVSDPFVFSEDVPVFDPVIPLFVQNRSSKEPQAASSILQDDDVTLLLEEHSKSVNDALDSIKKRDPNQTTSTNPFSVSDATVMFLLKQFLRISKSYAHQMESIEEMIWIQIRQAMGKHLQASDFEEFFRFHSKKIFNSEFVPRPFTYAVRKTAGHYLDGIVSIEEETFNSGVSSNPIVTVTRMLKEESKTPMVIPLSAAINVDFYGDIYLHSWFLHSFEGEEQAKFNLVARARQFSSFLLLVGNILSENEFSPKHAIIVQNKDEVVIPILLQTIPTPKAFKDAIESLSSEQQEFVKAFRQMQLDSSVVGICIIQLKPQLETVLSLPSGSLTKEIRLTQDILSLFIDYQIPPDLLSNDLEDGANIHDKLERVRSNVDVVLTLINNAKKNDLEEAKRRAEYENPFSTKAERAFDHENVIMESMPNTLFKDGLHEVPRRLRSSTMLRAHTEEAGVDQSTDSDIQTRQNILDLDSVSSSDSDKFDLASIPRKLDKKIELLDSEAVLCSTNISFDSPWTLRTKNSLLSDVVTKYLSISDQNDERNKSFDLLDAITKSGSLDISHAELHVIVATTHQFGKSLMETVVEDNINPIEKFEKSLLIVESSVYGVSVQDIVKKERHSDVYNHSPRLFDESRK